MTRSHGLTRRRRITTPEETIRPAGRRPRRPMLAIAALVVAVIAGVSALVWPSLAWAVAAALSVGVTLTALFVLMGSENATDERRGQGRRDPAELLERLPFGVLLVDPTSRVCTYRNAHATRWIPADAGTMTSPWEAGHLDNVAQKLGDGAFTESMPRSADPGRPPAEVRWETFGGQMLATLRDLSDREEQRVILDALETEGLPLDGMQPRRVALGPLCWDLAETLAGDRRPLGMEVHAPNAAALGDPALLRAAISQVVEHATGVGEALLPVTLRLVERDGTVAIQVDDGAGDPEEPVEVTGPEATLQRFGLAQHLLALYGGRLHVQRLGSGHRTELVLPRAP